MNTSPNRTVRKQPPPRLPKRVYTIRRVIAVIVLVVLIGLIVLACSSVYSWISAAQDSRARAKAQAEAESQVIQPVKCDLDKINFSVVPKGSVGEVGSTFPITLKAVNPNQTQPCLMDGSEDHLGIRITSGDDLIWDSQKCATKVRKQPLLLGSNVEFETDVEWDGTQWTSECRSGKESVGAGTYHVQAVLDGKLVGKEETFTLK